MVDPGEERTSAERLGAGAVARPIRRGIPAVGPWDFRCEICQRPITWKELQLFHACDDWRCREKYRARQRLLRQQKLEQDRHRERERQRRAALIRDRMAGPLGIERPDEFIVATVPTNPRSLVALTPERRLAFHAFLDQLVREASELPAKTDSDNPAEHGAAGNDDASLRAVLAGGCATCAGYCCLTAGDQAYLNVGVVRRFLDAHSNARPSDAVAAYEAYLGVTVYRDSCIFHGPQGCVLPRPMRSDICESYECESLRNLRWRCSGEGADRVFVAAMKDDVIVRCAFVPPGLGRA